MKTTAIIRMNSMLALLFLLPFIVFGQDKENKIDRNDLLLLTGGQWTGTLTYLDYTSNLPVTIPCSLSVNRAEENLFLFETTFPNETHKSEIDSVLLNKQGSTMGDETVLRRGIKGDTIVIVTEKTDLTSTPALQLRFTYKIHPRYLLITRVEKSEEAADFKERNRYIYTRD